MFKKTIITLVLLFAGSGLSAQKYTRIVSIGGSITEIIHQLGELDNVIASDTSSVYPDKAKNMPKVGYWMRLSSEGILSLRPDLVIASTQSKQPNVYQQLKDAGVRVVRIKDEPNVPGTYGKIKQIAKIFNKEKKAEKLIQKIRSGLNKAKSIAKKMKKKQRVLFIYARGSKVLMASGKGTQADTMIQIAGGLNTGNKFYGFKQINAEAVIAGRPDIILMLTNGIKSIGGPSSVWNLPGLKLTPAGKNKKIIIMDDLFLLGFTGRLGDAAVHLAKELSRGN